MIQIPEEEYKELKEKAEKYDEMIATRRRGAVMTNNISPEERKARAQKAAAARWQKHKNMV